MTYLDQLKQQRSTLENFLQLQRAEISSRTFDGMQITAQAYIEVLEDAIETVSLLIQYLEQDQ